MHMQRTILGNQRIHTLLDADQILACERRDGLHREVDGR
jgi:hypothetical protein